MLGKPTYLCRNYRHRVSIVTGQLFRLYTLLEVSPRAYQLLPQLCHVLYWRLVDSFLRGIKPATPPSDHSVGLAPSRRGVARNLICGGGAGNRGIRFN